jgi:hypothetical protein
MKKVTRNKVGRVLIALFHHRYNRRNNFRVNTATLQRLEASVAAQRFLRSTDPKRFASAGFYGPFGPTSSN